MKTISKILFIAVAAIFFLSANADAQDKKGTKKEVQVTFNLPDMSCHNCVNKLEAKMPHEKGVRDLKVTLEGKTIWISFDETTTTKEELAKALAKLGYPAKEVVKK